MRPAVGVVITTNHTVLYDAGNSPAHARQVQAALDLLDAPPVSHIVYSHHHWDHIFGAQVFTGATIIAHTLCNQRVIETSQQGWGSSLIAERQRKYPRMHSVYALLDTLVEWDDFEIALPTSVFETPSHTFEIDGLTFTAQHVGGAHADSSTVLSVDDVMFLADCFYAPPWVMASSDDGPDVAMLRRLLARGCEWYVDGHTGAHQRAFWHKWADSRKS